MNAELFLLEMDSESLIGRERGRWRSALASSSQCLCLSLALCSNSKITQKTTLALVWCHTWAYAECVDLHVCVKLRLVMRPWRWRLYIEGSCPVCQRALSATLFSDKALVKGLTPTGHGCWGGESSSSTPDLLACRRRLSQPPSPLLRLADTLHHNQHHPRGRPYLTLSQYVRSCLSTHTGRATETTLSWRV